MKEARERGFSKGRSITTEDAPPAALFGEWALMLLQDN